MTLELHQSLIAGSLSGLVSGFTFQPLEVLRTRSIGTKGISSTVIANDLYANHGISSFWRGTAASLARQIPGIALFYCMIEALNPKTSGERLMAGTVARSTATTIFLPLVVIKTKIEFGIQANMVQSSKFIYKSEGFRGFWKGLLPTLLRDGPYSGLYLVFYRQLQDTFPDFNVAYHNFIFAFTAGAAATILTQPADVLRCHLQIDHKNGFSNFKSHTQQRNLIRALFLDGLPPRIIRRSFVSAINWTIFEEAKKYFNTVP